VGSVASAVVVSVTGEGGVAVRIKGGVGDWREQDESRTRKRNKERRERDKLCGDMEGILTEMRTCKFLRIWTGMDWTRNPGYICSRL
jgi:hypothetical protein